MFQIIPVIYEEGVFKPLKKIRFRNHRRYMIRIDTPPTKKILDETIEILKNRGQLKRIMRALTHVKKGKLFSHKDVFGHPQKRK